MAKYTAMWGPKGFIVSPSKIVPFKDFKTTYALKSDSENDTSGTPPTNTRGRELQPITFSTTYVRAAGVDPRGQLDEWYALIGKSYPLYIGGKRFGPAKLTLKQVDVSDCLFTNGGDFLQVSIAITLEEYSEGKTSQLSSSASAKLSKSAAMSATASKADKAAKKK